MRPLLRLITDISASSSCMPFPEEHVKEETFSATASYPVLQRRISSSDQS